MSTASIITAAKTRSFALAARAVPLVMEEGPKFVVLALGLAAVVLMQGEPDTANIGITLTLGIRG